MIRLVVCFAACSASNTENNSVLHDLAPVQFSGACGDGGAPAAPSGTWKNVTHNLAGMASECGNVSVLSAKPERDRLITDVAQHGLWASDNGGDSWTAIGTTGDPITNRAIRIVYDPTHPTTYWESGIYNGFGVYRTDDDGVTFRHLGDSTHNDCVSLDFTDPQRRTLLAGGHE